MTARRFFITSYFHTYIGEYLKVVVHTDVPCHLTMRWTPKPMRMHKVSTDFRGRNYMWDPYFCIVETKPIDQEEEGDTWEHIFWFPGWGICETRWWYFNATTHKLWEPWGTNLTENNPWTSVGAHPPSYLKVQFQHLYFEANDIDEGWILTSLPAGGIPLQSAEGLPLRLNNLFGDCYSAAEWGSVTIFLQIAKGEETNIVEYLTFAGPGWVDLDWEFVKFNRHIAFLKPAYNRYRNILADWQFMRSKNALSTDPEGWALIRVWLGIEHQGGTPQGYANWGPIDFYPPAVDETSPSASCVISQHYKGPEEKTISITRSADDAYVYQDHWIKTYDPRVECGRVTYHKWSAGFLFRNVLLAPGSNILEARIYFLPAASRPGGHWIDLRGQAEPNPVSFTTLDDFVTRPRTVQFGAIPCVPIKDQWAYYSIKSILDEIIALPDWKAGNSIVIFFDWGTLAVWRFPIYSWDDDPQKAAYLYIKQEPWV